MTLYAILKQVKPSLEKKAISSNLDLLESGIFDSFEILELIMMLDKKYKFSYEDFSTKYKDFKISSFEKYLNKTLF